MFRLREECNRLFADRKLLRERVGFAYPEKYKSFQMFEELTKKGMKLCRVIAILLCIDRVADEAASFTVPDDAPNEIEYLKNEQIRLLGDTFTLVLISTFP